MGKYDLSRFTKAHQIGPYDPEANFDSALSEIKAGKKRRHWMWYIFPQIRGLGRTSASYTYGIENLEEAREFLADEYLGGNLRRICAALLELPTNRVLDVFAPPDHLKLCSSMTLFALAQGEHSIFDEVIEKFFGGARDPETIKRL